MRQRMILAFVVAVLLAGCASGQTGTGDPVIAPSEALARITQDSLVIVIDVRTQAEFDSPSGHVRGSILLPVQELEDRIAELAPYKARTIIAVCRSGNRSGKATQILREHGFEAFNMTGGMNRWNAEGLPVQHTETR
jgi:rhodanese-related sulfurtransferase